MLNKTNNNSDDGKKQSRLARFRKKVVSPIASRSKALAVKCARPFTPVVVWLYTHPRISILCVFFVPTWFFKMAYVRVDPVEETVELAFAPWVTLSLCGAIFALTKLNIMLYKNLVGGAVDPSEPHAMAAFGEDSEFEVSENIDEPILEIVRDLSSKLAALGMELQILGYAPFGAGSSSKFDVEEWRYWSVKFHLPFTPVRKYWEKGALIVKGQAYRFLQISSNTEFAGISIPFMPFTIVFDLNKRLELQKQKAAANRAYEITKQLMRVYDEEGVCGICDQNVTQVPKSIFFASVQKFIRQT